MVSIATLSFVVPNVFFCYPEASESKYVTESKYIELFFQ